MLAEFTLAISAFTAPFIFSHSRISLNPKCGNVFQALMLCNEVIPVSNDIGEKFDHSSNRSPTILWLILLIFFSVAEQLFNSFCNERNYVFAQSVVGLVLPLQTGGTPDDFSYVPGNVRVASAHRDVGVRSVHLDFKTDVLTYSHSSRSGILPTHDCEIALHRGCWFDPVLRPLHSG